MVEQPWAKLDGGEIITIVAVGGGLLLALVLGGMGIIFVNWRRWRQFQCEVALKNEMVRKEMRVEDIERVIRVTHPDNTEAGRLAATKPAEPPVQDLTPRQLDVKIAAILALMDLDAEKIEQVLGAVVAADLDGKRAVLEALTQMTDDGAEEDRILACIGALCKTSRTAAITTL